MFRLSALTSYGKIIYSGGEINITLQLNSTEMSQLDVRLKVCKTKGYRIDCSSIMIRADKAIWSL